MTNSNSNNTRIAKNTIVLYIRLLITMAISLYTARVVLDVLGVNDYGIYNVTGSIISMFSFVSSTMSTATQRYLSYELGKGDGGDTRNVFTQSLYSYLLIIIIIVVVGETIGLWLLNKVLVIPEDRILAANIVYQFSILTFICSVMHAPLNAAIIAMERVKAFAYGAILLSLLSLISVIILDKYRFTDALVAYAIFVFIANVIVTIYYWCYCSKNFSFCRLTLGRYDKNLIRQMTSFAFWNVIGTITNILRNHGVNMLLNIFFSPAINAARAVAIRINTTIMQFSSNFFMAVRPQLVKLYSSNQSAKMLNLGYQSSRFAFFLMFVLIIPVFCEVEGLLSIWLTIIPDYTIIFARIILLTSLLEVLCVPLDHMMQAAGRLKKYQLFVCSINILNLPISFIFLKLGCSPEYTMYINLSLLIITFMPRLLISRTIINLKITDYIKNVVLRIFPPSFCAVVWILFYQHYLAPYEMNSIVMLAGHFIIVSLFVLLLGLSRQERKMILNVAKKRFNKNIK